MMDCGGNAFTLQKLLGHSTLTEDGSSAAFRSADYVPADDTPTDATDFQIDSLEYAEGLGGRVYRLRFIQSVEKNIMLFTLQANQSTNWNNNIALFKMGMSAGSHELLYFVSNSALRDCSRVLIRVRNANHSNECNFYIDLNPDDDPKNNG